MAGWYIPLRHFSYTQDMSLQYEICSDLQVMECDLKNPTFLWNGVSYNFVPSITSFNRDLDKGGFNMVRLMTATVRKYDLGYKAYELVPLFTNGYPQSQIDKIVYSIDGLSYRIESFKEDPTGAYFRLIAHSTTRGI
jgi:hypothetical protein